MNYSLISYQGVNFSTVRFQRSTGLDPDTAYLSIPKAHLTELQLQSLLALRPGADGYLQDPEVRPGDVRSVEGAFSHVGDLLVEEDVDGVVYPVFAQGMFVSSVEIESANDPTNADVNLTLVDDRAFWNRGSIVRHRFNPRSPDGSPLPYTVGSLTRDSLAAVVAELCSQLPGAPPVVRVPKVWEETFPTLDFAPLSSPRLALLDIKRDFPYRVSLNYDRSVSFYLPGEANAPGFNYTFALSPVHNGEPIPDAFLADAFGQGAVKGVSLGYAPDYVTVVGAPRVATVAIDAWEPVIFYRGAYRNLYLAFNTMLEAELNRNIAEAKTLVLAIRASLSQVRNELRAARERSLRFTPFGDPVTRARRDFNTSRRRRDREAQEAHQLVVDLRQEERETLEAIAEAEARVIALEEETPLKQAGVDDIAELEPWLRRFILRFSEDSPREADSVLLAQDDIELLSKQAFRFWRMPGLLDYNRHLLPMVARAEVENGIRKQPYVEISGFKKRSGRVALASDGKTVVPARGVSRAKSRAQRLEAAYRKTRVAIIGVARSSLLGRVDLGDVLDTLVASPRSLGNTDEQGLKALRQKLLADAREAQQSVVGDDLVPQALRTGVEALALADDIVLTSLHAISEYTAQEGEETVGEIKAGLEGRITQADIAVDPITDRTLDDIAGRALAENTGAYHKAVDALIKKVGRSEREGRFVALPQNLRQQVRSRAMRAAHNGLELLLPKLLADELGVEGLGAAYERVLKARNDAIKASTDEFFFDDLDLEIARELFKVAREFTEIRVTAVLFEGIDPVSLVDDRIVGLLRQRLDREQDYKAGVFDRGEETYASASFYHNLAPDVDPGARIDREHGIIETTRLPGHLDRTDVSTLHGREFIPRPVRVFFGVELDRLPAVPGTNDRWWNIHRDAVGNEAQEVNRDIFPPLAREAERSGAYGGHTAFHFQRVGDTLVLMDEPPPPGRTVVIRNRSLRELIRVDGKTNYQELVPRAREYAAARFAAVPDVTTNERRLYFRPWATEPDGQVSGVQISSLSHRGVSPVGFSTEIVKGDETRPFLGADKRRAEAGPTIVDKTKNVDRDV